MKQSSHRKSIKNLYSNSYRPFVVDACSHNSKLPDYNGLKDNALRGFFASKVRIKQLRSTGIITKDGIIRTHRQLQIIDRSNPTAFYTDRNENYQLPKPKTGNSFGIAQKLPPVGKRTLLMSHNLDRQNNDQIKFDQDLYGQMSKEDFTRLLVAVKKKVSKDQ